MLAGLRARMFQASTSIQIGRYRLRRQLGQGAHGSVFEAEDTELRRLVALKVLRPDRTSSAQQRTRLREARSLAQLSHPHVVEVYDAGITEGQIWIAMELVRGVNAAQWSARHPPGSRGRFERVRTILDQAASGVAAAHECGLIHRDLKPANVLVGDDGRVRVADFGLARAGSTRAERCVSIPDDPEGSITVMAGTPRYMSPEQLRGEPVDAASDQFGFAVTAWELVFGTHPFVGISLEQRAQSGDIRPVAGSGSVVPAAYARALQRALAIDPAVRFASMEELRQALSPRPRTRRGIAAVFVGVTVLALTGWLAGAPAEVVPPPSDREADPTAELTAAPAADPTADPTADPATDRTAGDEPPIATATPQQRTLSDQLARARADLDAGRYAIAVAQAEAIATEAERARLGTLAADAYEVCGTAWGELDDPRRFEAFETAYYLAAELTDGRDLARHANSLAMQHAYRGQLDQAERWIRHAEAGLQRHPDDAQASTLEHVQGLIQLKRGDLPAAITTFERVLDRLAGASAGTNELAWLAGNALLMAQMSTGRTDEATALALRLRQQTVETLGPSHPRLARISMAQARLARVRDDFAKAIEFLDEAVRLSERGYGMVHHRTAIALLTLGWAHARAGDDAAAEQNYRRGLVAIGDAHDQFRVRLLRGLAMMCTHRGDESCAERWLQAAVSSGRRFWPEDSPELARVERDLAEALLRQGRANEAAYQLRAALEGLGSSAPAPERARLVVDLARARAQGARVPELPALRGRVAASCRASPETWSAPWCQRLMGIARRSARDGEPIEHGDLRGAEPRDPMNRKDP